MQVPKYTMTDLVDERILAGLLADVASGRVTVDAAVERLRDLPYERVDGARIDHHRELRTGAAEAIYGPGKTVEQVVAAARALVARASGGAFVTRASDEQADAVVAAIPDARVHPRSGLIVLRRAAEANGVEQDTAGGHVAIVTAGTSDLSVAEEAARTVEALGPRVEELVDVGVAGIHRVLDLRRCLDAADCAVVVAGMEGALPSVVAGLISTPVIAVPTSVGYGASFEGLAALLGMLSSCAPGVTVVNIDNGFGAAQAAYRILRAARATRA
jgi:pyridinium-3,5-biscarboxylic acid mononucleotide synthase